MSPKRTPKYGMSFQTIRYWQNLAYNLHSGIDFATTFRQSLEQLQKQSARDIGHAAISVAFVYTDYQTRNILRTGRAVA